jgi:hypothetical protein
MSTISEQEFKKLCDEVYADRLQIYTFNPNVSRSEALFWMLLGCLVSLLSIPIPDQPSVYGGASSDPYGDAICEVLKGRTEQDFDPRTYLAVLSVRVEAEAAAVAQGSTLRYSEPWTRPEEPGGEE